MLKALTEQGPAFDIRYHELWAPGVELAAGLIARANGDADVGPAACVAALFSV